MIITEEEYRDYSNDDVKNLMSEYNKKYGIRFGQFYNDGNSPAGVLINNSIKIPYKDLDSYVKAIPRTMFMTDEEYLQEVKAGHIKGVHYTGDKIVF